MNDLAQQAGRILTEVRARRPLIHHITNWVTIHSAANITLSAGALPVMAHALEEVEEMVEAADALVLNLGTLWPGQVEAMLRAGYRANVRGIPVILDPVGAGATRLRTASAQRLLRELSIAIVRGNAAEMAVLSGRDAKIRGVESGDVQDDASGIAHAAAQRYGCVAAVTGPVDRVADGRRLLRVANGHAAMTQSTGTGCMATAVTACFAAVEADFARAAAAALAAYGLAGEQAALASQGPGTFEPHLIDAFAALTEEAVAAGAHIEEDSQTGSL